MKNNALKGFYIQYDDHFDSIFAPKYKEDKEKDKELIKLEINFEPNGSNVTDTDRDGISHIAGNYSKTKSVIKFLIFKYSSGKTFYIGDNTEEQNEDTELFLFGLLFAN